MTTEEQKKKHNEYMKKWRKTNPEKVRRIQKKANDKFKPRQQEWRRNNKDKIREYEKSYAEKYPEKIQAKEIRRTLAKYGLSPQQYDAVLLNQGGVCAICGLLRGIKRLAVDHDHKTNKVRGLLCQFCNTALGKFLDDVEILKKAILYLEKSQQEEYAVK